jgi:hypothetical protein
MAANIIFLHQEIYLLEILKLYYLYIMEQIVFMIFYKILANKIQQIFIPEHNILPLVILLKSMF